MKQTSLLNSFIALALASMTFSVTAATSYSFRHPSPGVKATAAAPVAPPAPTGFATFDSTTLKQTQLDAAKLTLTKASGSGYGNALGSVAKSSGKWYWEVRLNGSGTNTGFGVCPTGTQIALGDWGSNPGCVTLWTNGLYVGGSHPKSLTLNYQQNVVLGFALDMDAKTLNVFRNNVSVTPGSHLWTNLGSTAMAPIASLYSAGEGTVTANFGASPFVYAPPAGYNAGLYQSP